MKFRGRVVEKYGNVSTHVIELAGVRATEAEMHHSDQVALSETAAYNGVKRSSG